MISWSRLLSLFRLSENKILMLLALIVGLVTGLSAWLFIRAIELIQFWPPAAGKSLFLGWPMNRFLIVAIPAMGGLLCGLVIQYGSATAKGTGTADIMYALRRKGGHLSARHTFFKIIASLFTVCSGGAAGPEGPVVSIGSGVGSLLGEWRDLKPENRKNLVVAGAAAGFAAVFNAPIAGVLFAIEVLLKEFASQAFALVILSTVTASVTTHLLLGNRVFVEVPASFTFSHIWELGFYAVLAVLAAIVSKAFVQLYFFVEHHLEEWKRMPQAIKTMIGGALLGLLALYIPQVMGNGHVEIPNLIQSEMIAPWAWTLLVLLLAGKMLACSLTLGSGGSGGIFIPYLLMGALLGGMVGRGVHLGYPAAAPVGAYMLVGMGAVFAGITYAPFTAIILLFELTQDYNIILPLMFTVGITLLVAKALDPESMDSRKLLKKGVRTHETSELRTLEKYHAEELMTRKVLTIAASMTLAQVTDFISRHTHTGYPVVSAEGCLVGLITYTELHQAAKKEAASTHAVLAQDIMRTRVPTVYPDESLTEAIRRMQKEGADRVVVLERSSETIVGLLTKSDMIGIYRTLLGEEAVV
jgi:CIC family chloride channel protein